MTTRESDNISKMEERKHTTEGENKQSSDSLIFENVTERSVTFCIDTSGTMYKCLHLVKEQLVEALYSHAKHGSGEPLFNIIEFNSQITQWSDKMVKCTPETVAVASKWIDELSAKSGTNTQDALATAFSDEDCQAVYLVTDSLPDQHPEEVLDHVAYICGNRPVHCIFLMGDKVDSSATEFLEDLAIETYGSFYIACINTSGSLQKISPVYKSDHSHLRNVNEEMLSGQATLTPTLPMDPPDFAYLNQPIISPAALPANFPPSLGFQYYHPAYWSRYRPAKGWVKVQDKLLDEAQDLELSPAAGNLLLGKKVLARRQEDGYFYLGTVQGQVYQQKFLIAFNACKHGKYKEPSCQETLVHDILDYEDAKRRTVVTGDKVLSPWEPEGERFGPGVVIDGFEKREAQGPDDKTITVSLSNGKTEKVAPDTAIWIPDAMYDRLSLELTMPKKTREKMASQPNYPAENLPGYPTSGPIAHPHQYPKPAALVLESDVPLDHILHRFPPYMPAYPIYLKRRDSSEKRTKSVVKSEDMNALIPGTKLTRKELEDRVTSQLMEHKLLLDEKENEKGSRRLLDRRGLQNMNSLKKSVSFNDENLVEMSATPRDYFSPRFSDSGYGSEAKYFESHLNGYHDKNGHHYDRNGYYDSNGTYHRSGLESNDGVITGDGVDTRYGYYDKEGQFVPDPRYHNIGYSDKYNQSEYRDMKHKCRDRNMSEEDREFWRTAYDKGLSDMKNNCTNLQINEGDRERLRLKFDNELNDLKYRCRDRHLPESDREYWRGSYCNELNDIKQRCSDPNIPEHQREYWKYKYDDEMKDLKERCRNPNLTDTDRDFWRNMYNNEMRDVEFMRRDPKIPPPERDYWKDVYDYELRDLEYRSADPDISDRERNDWKMLFEHIGSSKDTAVNTDSSLLFYQRPRSANNGKRPPWRYWKAEPSPPLLDTNTELVERGLVEGFRETAIAPPLEVRSQPKGPYIVEWKDPSFNFVDPFARHNYTNSITDVLKPKPPSKNVSFNKADYCEVPKELTKQQIADARRQYRRRKIIQRHLDLQEKISEEHNMKSLMKDQHRERIIEQLNKERERQINEQQIIEKAREAKKNISAEIRARIETNQQREQSRDDQRIAALARQREHREALQAQREKEINDIASRRQAVKEQQNRERVDNISRKLDSQEAERITIETKRQNAKIRRMHHFQQLEQNEQRKKELQVAVKDQQRGLQISQIFS